MPYDTIQVMQLSTACVEGFQAFLVGVLALAAVALMAREGKPASPGQTPPV